MKDFQVFENSKAKASTALLDYKDTSTFQGFFLIDNNVQSSNHKSIALSICQADALTITSQSKKKVKPTTKAKKIETIIHRLSQKAKKVEKTE